MKEHYTEGVANHCGVVRIAVRLYVKQLTGRGTSRPAIELRNHSFEVPTLYYEVLSDVVDMLKCLVLV